MAAFIHNHNSLFSDDACPAKKTNVTKFTTLIVVVVVVLPLVLLLLLLLLLLL